MARKPRPPHLVPPQRARARPVSPVETALWHTAMKDAKPLGARRRKKKAPAKPPAAKASPRPTSSETPTTTRRPAAEFHAAVRPGAEPPGIDRTTSMKLRRGQMPLEGRIDLHGMTQAAAHRALNGFIVHAREAGSRCLLVITGKGAASSGEIGVLRANLPRWLGEAPLRGFVLAAVPAMPKDGGDGAFYVLLRRKRGERTSRQTGRD